MEQLLNIDELAANLGVPRSWIYGRTRRTGPEVIPHYKIGKYLRFRESEVLEYLNKKAINGKVIQSAPV